jgi:HAD superfamily hydrolase (TIGR01662 family)
MDLGHTLAFQAHLPDEDELFGQMAAQVRPVLSRWRESNAVDLRALLQDLFGALEPAQEERRARGLEVDAPFVTRGALAAYGIEVSDADARAFWRATTLDLTAWGWQLYPDSLDTLRRLRGRSVPIAIVSNSRHTSDLRYRLLTPLGLTDALVDVFVFSADLMRPKPRPEPFQRALRQLAVAAQDALFVGDDLEADIRGAKALGMTTVWKLNGRHDSPVAPEADFRIHDLGELFGLGVFDVVPSAAARAESLMPHEDDNEDRY